MSDKLCGSCMWWHKLKPAHDKTDLANCLALDYPACVETVTTADNKCMVPHLYHIKLTTTKEPPCEPST